MKPDDRIRLTHMAEALGHAIRFVAGAAARTWTSTRCRSFALVHALQAVGEAANNVSQDARRQSPQIPSQ